MQIVKALEFQDLAPQVAERVKEEFISYQVEADLRALGEDLDDELITEEQYYKEIGCSKYYAESTSWFVPSCYYEHHQEQVDTDVAGTLENALFNEWGTVISIKEWGNALAQSS